MKTSRNRRRSGKSGARRSAAGAPRSGPPRGELLYGRQAVRETLRAGRRHCYELYLADGVKENESVREIRKLAETQRIPIHPVKRPKLDEWLLNINHQGVVLRAGGYPYGEVTAMLARAQQRQAPPFLLLLDRIQDPQNLGSLFRAAEAFGVHGVILPRRRAAHITPAVVNASAGAVEHLIVATATNLVQEMKLLKQAGVWIVGLEAHPDAVSLSAIDVNGPLAVVVGSEGFGLSRLVRETCDWLVKLPMRGHINSLNAAVAGSVFLFWAMQQRSE